MGPLPAVASVPGGVPDSALAFRAQARFALGAVALGLLVFAANGYHWEI